MGNLGACELKLNLGARGIVSEESLVITVVLNIVFVYKFYR